jgi:hypothetical protein
VYMDHKINIQRYCFSLQPFVSLDLTRQATLLYGLTTPVSFVSFDQERSFTVNDNGGDGALGCT